MPFRCKVFARLNGCANGGWLTLRSHKHEKRKVSNDWIPHSEGAAFGPIAVVQPLGVKVGQSAPPPAKNLPKSGKMGGKREEEGKIRKKRENREEKEKIGNFFLFLFFFSLCPSWQIGLATLLSCYWPIIRQYIITWRFCKRNKWIK